MTNIETTVIGFLNGLVPAYGEVPEELPADMRFAVVEKTGESRTHTLYSATVAIQSYGQSKAEAMQLNDRVIQYMGGLIWLPDITHCELNSNYPYADTNTKRYRYQAVFSIFHY